jgi:hypothetical protein
MASQFGKCGIDVFKAVASKTKISIEWKLSEKTIQNNRK